MRNTTDLERTAYHEAGHAIVWLEIREHWTSWSPIDEVSIITRGNDSGSVTFDDGRHGADITKLDQLSDFLVFNFAGFAAERKRDPETDFRFTRWNCRADDDIALLVFAFHQAATLSQKYIRVRQHSLISVAQQRFCDTSSSARQKCQEILDLRWESVQNLAHCLVRFGKVNGAFAEWCFAGNQIPKPLMGTATDPADIDRVREVLRDSTKCQIGPSDEEEAAAWEETVRKSRESIGGLGAK